MTSRTTATAVAMALVLAGGLSACSNDEQPAQGARTVQPAGASAGGSTARPAPSSTAPAPPAKVVMTPADRSEGVPPSSPVKVAVTGGEVSDVKVVAREGEPIEGTFADGTWTPRRNLKLDTTYDVTATITRADGTTQPVKSSFATLRPGTVAKYALTPMEDSVGVGMPAMVSFSSSVKDPRFKAEVEKHLKVTTTPAVAGSWGWVDDRRVMWRPASYWRPGTKVTVEALLDGVQTGKDKWVTRDDKEQFTIARSQVAKVDMKTHQMSVFRDGKLVKTIPVTTGKPGFTTRSGTKVIMEKVGHMTMDSETVGIPKGDPNYYKLDTEWNMRLTTTGEFLHAAPWSQWAQGRQNVSHGCTNMSMADAKWMFDTAMVGDPVEFTGTDKPFLDEEGITVWQYTWTDWQKKSALPR
ncbi:Ig-like domain-containing protein [Arsenicicoccus dermatophilus]|uniref:L,D-transpeptidase n=1 Tax=Arsenicicoccus dermatophilus TaxID=1076331 RepID=UPI003917247B